jgi:hypothetical protein
VLFDEIPVPALMHGETARNKPPYIFFLVVLELSPFYYEISSIDDTLSNWKYVRGILR